MTEDEWFACADPELVLRQVEEQTSERKLRLMACAFCRRIWHLLPDDISRGTIELCECVVDGLADDQPLWARGGFHDPDGGMSYPGDTVEFEGYVAARFLANCMELIFDPHSAPEIAAGGACRHARRASRLSGILETEESLRQCVIIRDIVGNPFRPPVFEPIWRSETVAQLADQIYLARDFSAMPILADALQDAGCDNDDILNHCRDEKQVHVRGCWVVDLVLGKS